MVLRERESRGHRHHITIEVSSVGDHAHGFGVLGAEELFSFPSYLCRSLAVSVRLMIFLYNYKLENDEFAHCYDFLLYIVSQPH